ncbi:MAG: amidohydrolase [Myxococcales bacterium]|nr:amidohydrolase [Myxococcales bacterium]
MKFDDAIVALVPQVTEWRRHLHAHPETAFVEHDTARFVASTLRGLGYAPHLGLGGTGVVASLQGAAPGPAIALRADIDALPMDEEGDVPHRSTRPGAMHACGHDGHTAMLLGAAAALAKRPDFGGTVHFIFQPAEEGAGGAKVMMDQGLFTQFPTDRVFGLHNWPGLPMGEFAVHSGAVMAAVDDFEVAIEGLGGHAAMPHLVVDPIVGAAQIITAAQSLVSRRVDPTDSAVLSITSVHGGSAFNVVPRQVTLRGTARSFKPEVRASLEARFARLVHGICGALDLKAQIAWRQDYPPTINTAPEADLAARAAEAVVGAARVHRDPPPSMGGEDFAFMLEAKPGCYAWLGTGPAHGLHHPRYDFNDAVLPIGITWWTRLVQTALPMPGG